MKVKVIIKIQNLNYLQGLGFQVVGTIDMKVNKKYKMK
jgi:hypothetical protein